MHHIALSTALLLVLATGPARAASDGRLTREEAMEIARVPLERTIGRAEAEQVQRVAVANALLEHCRLDWERLFGALTAYHRHRRGRGEADMNRITVWHGVWQGQALAMLRRDRPGCDEETRRAALGNAALHLRALAPGDRGA